MKTYLISLLGAAFLAAAIGILTPEGSGGIGKHVRLLSVLVLLCVIAAPLPRAWVRLREFTAELPDGGTTDPDTGWLKVDYEGKTGWVSGKYGRLV